jgi:hypothetical protein
MSPPVLAPPSTASHAAAWLSAVVPATEHACEPSAGERVTRAKGMGYYEAFHETNAVLADVRARVLQRIGFQTLVEGASDGWLVLAKPIERAPREPKEWSSLVVADDASGIGTDA